MHFSKNLLIVEKKIYLWKEPTLREMSFGMGQLPLKNCFRRVVLKYASFNKIVIIRLYFIYLFITDGFGSRSPGGGVGLTSVGGSGGNKSPRAGRSLREHEEQLNTLRKENFNLKLRIYFLEEKTASAALSAGSESLYKQNVDLKVILQ